MAKIKYTKNELKAQRDALKRFRRYLPTLLLKKQQLQMELRGIDQRIEAQAAAERAVYEEIEPWIKLFASPMDLSRYLQLVQVKTVTGNIAGVNIPVLKEVVFHEVPRDLHATPSWIDDGVKTMARLLRMRVELQILREQRRLVGEELRTTSQRVNLFEKVKIPEARNNIRIIRIFLGDVMTSEVARGKIAKKKSAEGATT
ncbi:MAG TPA: V-type ATP synthase subunit D [Kiritimatiellia bacterium]|nr:V-type ATP synthase subunit D [Kiritimatiellia bacterium]HMP00155.1 V-type ATP synthase subunit D [Kiritimatiellia bacterium]HMP96909.1 V-type ATP synthase subunit D [Kiritimatiellia bacterium]